VKVALPAHLQIIRPGNVIITGFTVFVGGIIASHGIAVQGFGLLLAAISAALVAAGANALNDYYDVAIDLINRPDRAIPSGRISLSFARLVGWLLIVMGIATGFVVEFRLGLVAVIVATLLWQYNKVLKRTYFRGNLAVALCGGAAFIYGGLAVDKISASVIPALFAFLIHLAREIVKDVDDVVGDRAAGSKTIPIISGERVALILASTILIILALSTPLPYFLQIYSLNYLYFVSLTVTFPLLILAIAMIRGLSQSGVKRTSFFLKLLMITGLISLYVG